MKRNNFALLGINLVKAIVIALALILTIKVCASERTAIEKILLTGDFVLMATIATSVLNCYKPVRKQDKRINKRAA